MKCGRQTIRCPFRGKCLKNALLWLNQASGLAGGFDYGTPHHRPPLTRADSPVSGENVRKADKGGRGPGRGGFCEAKDRGRDFSPCFSPSVNNQRFLTPPSSEGGRSLDLGLSSSFCGHRRSGVPTTLLYCLSFSCDTICKSIRLR